MGVVALVPAAGRGERLGAMLPKALVPVAGIPLLTRAVTGLLRSGYVDEVIVAAPPEYVDTMVDLVAGHGVSVVAGGVDRTSSVRLALAAAPVSDFVLVHDAARAFTPAEVIGAVVEALRSGARAVIPVLPVADTVKSVASGMVTQTVDRSVLRTVQTPQGFTTEVLREAYERCADALTDDAGMVERIGVPVQTVQGHAHAMKITTPFDLAIAQSVLA